MGKHRIDLAAVRSELIEGGLHAIGAVGGLTQELFEFAHIGAGSARKLGVALELATHFVKGRLARNGVEPAIEGSRLTILIAVPGI